MAFKYQCKMIVQPEEILFITRKHLETMKSLISGSPNASFVQIAEQKMNEMCETFTSYDYIIVRQ